MKTVKLFQFTGLDRWQSDARTFPRTTVRDLTGVAMPHIAGLRDIVDMCWAVRDMLIQELHEDFR